MHLRHSHLFGALVALALLTTTGCGTAQTPAAPAGGGTAAPAGPKTGGVLTAVFASDPNEWDMRGQGKTGVNVQLHGLVYETLLRFKHGSDVEYSSQILQPRLAERWEVAPDGKAFTFTLRKGVKFQNVPPVNGRALTSADVKWSLDYYSARSEFEGKKVPASQVDFMYEGLDKVEAPDANTVVVRFKDPYAPFLNYAASQWMPIAAKEVYQQDGSLKDHLIGTGPFTFDDKATQKGTVWVVKKNPDYWNASSIYLDGIKRLVLPEIATAQAAFATKQVDAWADARIVAQTAQAVKSTNPQATLFTYRVPIGNALLISQKKTKALTDARVRRAISLAIDREEHSKVLFGGEGAPFIAGSWPGIFTQQEAAALTKYDTAQAQQLLQQAGIQPGGLTLEMIITNTDDTAQHQLLQAQLKKVGIEVKFTILPREQHRPRLYAGDFDIYRNSGAGLLEADVDSFLFGEFYSQSTLNWVGTNDPELDKMLLATRQTLDPQKRNEAIKAAARRINEQGYDPGIVYPANWAFSQSYVKNWRPHFANGETEAFAWLDK